MLAPGSKLGPYEILAQIGVGGMGEVWKARDSRLNRTVAIKISHRQFNARFEREAHAIAALNHPNICQLYDVGPDYLVMEYVDGTPLKGPLPLKQALLYGVQLCEALDAAHRKGVVHQDLKPSNVLLTKEGVKLLDFGLAKLATDETITMAGNVMGTPAYIAPEQRDGKRGDVRSDIYSFGCVLYEMLTGKKAATDRSGVGTLPAALQGILAACLEEDPEDRWQCVRDIKRAFNLSVATTPGTSRTWKASAAAALAVGLFGGWLGSLAVKRFLVANTIDRAFHFEIEPPQDSRFSFVGADEGLALSPDGTTAAYLARFNGKVALWIRTLNGSSARMLPGTEGARQPFWSPDSKSLGFFVGAKLLRADIASGWPFPICAVPNASRGGAWTSDGRIVFGASGSPLFQVNASGGTPSRLTTLDRSRGESYHYWPQILPGGRFLYWVQSRKPENVGVYAASLANPAQRVQLLNADTNALYASGGNGINYLLWLRGTTLMAQEFDARKLKLVGKPQSVVDPVSSNGAQGFTNATASANGLLLYDASNIQWQFTWFDRAGNRLGVVGEPGSYSNFSLSPDGRRIAAARSNGTGADLWLLEVDERGVASRFTSGPGVSWWPVWSADGHTIVYSGGARNLFRKSIFSSAETLSLTQSPFLQNPLDWSRDGRWILYYQVQDGRRDLWVQPVSPDGKATGEPSPYLRTAFNSFHARFSPEASPRWVAYESDETGQWEIYVQTFPQPRRARRISTSGGKFPHWGPGGREIIYLSPGNELMSVSLTITADSVEPSPPSKLFSLPELGNGVDPYEVANDGKRLLLETPYLTSQPLHVIVNWPALLEKRDGQ